MAAQDQRSESLAFPKIDPSRVAIPEANVGEILGYPAVTADKRVVLQLLRIRNFGELDRYFSGIQASVKQRIQLEYEWVDASRAFETADSTLGPLLNEWVAASPNSSHARTARATWYRARAWHARGQNYLKDTPQEAIRQMEAFAGRSAQDAMAALRIDSTDMIAHTELIGVLLFGGGKEQARAVLDAGRKVYPGSYYLPHQYLYLLEPRWGGSLEEMAGFASAIAADSVLNPRLRTFLGAVEAEKSEEAIDQGKFTEGVNHANAALSYGPEFYWQVQRGHSRVHFNDNDRGIIDINVALAQRPQYVPALEFHAMATLSSSQFQEEALRITALNQARHDFELILSIDPTNDYAINGLKDVNNQAQHCLDDWEKCHEKEVGAGTIAVEVAQQAWSLFKYLGVAALIGAWGFIKWFRNGFWLPRYIHLIAFLALVTVCFIDIMWVKAGMPMTVKRWMVIPAFPLMVYFLFIGLGGSGWASRK